MRIKGKFIYTVNLKLMRKIVLCLMSVLLSTVIFINMDELSKALTGKFVMYINILSNPKATINTLLGKKAVDSVDDIQNGSHLLPKDENEAPNTSENSQNSENLSDIPKEYQAKIVEEFFGSDNDERLYTKHDNVVIRNYTKLSNDDIQKVLSKEFEGKYVENPTVLIYHTHATESYEKYDTDIYDTRNTWRDTDNTNNMVAVGEVLADELRKLGVNVIHDTTQHDFPSYNGSYNRSKVVIDKYLKENPNIVMTLDIHRDGIIRSDDTIVKPTLVHNGEKYAQIMLMAPSESKTVKVPKWRDNLRFAASLYTELEKQLEGISRPIFFDYRYYNLDATTASLLIEIGSNANTIEEAKRSAALLAKPIYNILNTQFKKK